MSAIEDLMLALDKEIGSNAEAQSVTQFIDTGFAPLNKIISGRYDGGLPFGRMIEMFGDSSTGKTALASNWMIKAQQMGGVAIFIDWERSFDVEMAKANGLNDQRPYWIYSRPKTWEEGNIVATKACALIRKSKAIPDNAPILVVFDSIAAAIPQSSSEKEIDELTMNDTSALARVTSTTLKNQAQHCAEYNATYLYLNQVREAIGVIYGDKVKTPGGKAMEFYSTVRMSLSRQKIVDKDKEMIGQNISIKCTKSKLTAPFKSCKLRLSFDELGAASFDEITSTLEYLVDKSILPSSGGRIEWEGKKLYLKDVAERIREAGDYQKLLDILVN